MRKFSILLLLLLFIFSKSAEAKILPQAKKSGTKTVTQKTSTGTTIGVTPKLRADRRAITLYFSNLQNAKSVSYALTYNTSTQQEGAIGSIALGGPSATQELLFGTCSRNVCRYHTSIRDARLEVSYTSQTGTKYLKKYKIRI